jgi:copper(I)-binding protein
MANTLKRLITLLIISTVVTSCGAGQNAVTRNFKQVTDGVEAQSAEIRLRNVLIVKTATNDAVLVGTLVNWSDESDAITGISINNIPATLSAGSFELVKNKPVIFVGDSANADAYTPGLTEVAGERIPVTFTFATAAPVTVDALILNSEGFYKDLVRVTKVALAP